MRVYAVYVYIKYDFSISRGPKKASFIIYLFLL